MARPSVLLAWLVCSFVSVTARTLAKAADSDDSQVEVHVRPLAPSPSSINVQAHELSRAQARSSPYKDSIQILYKENVYSYAHGWSVYFGPQGIPVNPCYAAPFERVYDVVEEKPAVLSSLIDDLPFTPKEKWPGIRPLYDGVNCSIAGSGESLPILACGEVLSVEFQREPGHDDITTCRDGYRFRRAYYAEYTA
ncbi:hypothetical protein T440DRAFT_302843 [Plenodomus tracheiphilus IPT5]|uniref:Ubiquitin 3 binding protein But2 C-terminal domain-containing protein n=1 Tax=Plenodomus tracheiphilus IPT5 TaxID=1408161 RepID=A0A6A7ANF0_9PLEO|nr:hypothetical protein T440DRAFT_302843 [Plenodomus tracheiphilus IPT5]